MSQAPVNFKLSQYLLLFQFGFLVKKFTLNAFKKTVFKYIWITSEKSYIGLGPTLGARIYGIIWGQGGREYKQIWWKVVNISAGLKKKLKIAKRKVELKEKTGKSEIWLTKDVELYQSKTTNFTKLHNLQRAY